MVGDFEGGKEGEGEDEIEEEIEEEQEPSEERLVVKGVIVASSKKYPRTTKLRRIKSTLKMIFLKLNRVKTMS